MSETMQIIAGLFFVLCAYILSQMLLSYRVRRLMRVIIRHLDSQKAYQAESAVELHASKPSTFRMGLRNLQPKAIEALIQAAVISRTPDGKYYLKKSLKELKL